MSAEVAVKLAGLAGIGSKVVNTPGPRPAYPFLWVGDDRLQYVPGEDPLDWAFFCPWHSADDCFLLADALMDAEKIGSYSTARHILGNGCPYVATVYHRNDERNETKWSKDSVPAALFNALAAALLPEAP